MDSALRPKDIQARIRAGETPDTVAEAAQISVERIMVYVLPVLAEREHIASLARAAAVRRRHAGVPSRLLGEAVDQQLRALRLEPRAARWDAWRRQDGRWTVTVDPGGGHDVGTYLFDVSGRYAVADDDAGRGLVGDVPPTAAAEDDEMAIAVAVSGRSDGADPAVAPGPADEAAMQRPPYDPDEDPDEDPDVEPLPEDRTEEIPVVADVEPAKAGMGLDQSPAPGLDVPIEPDPAPATAASPPADSEDVQLVLDEMDTDGVPPTRRKRERKRPSVPSWDEIVFGGGGGRSDG